MTAATLTFRPDAIGREVAMLGTHVVAEIIPCGNRATVIFKLPGMLPPNRPASSFDAARRKIEHEAREWLIAAELQDVASRLVVRVLTDETEQRARA